MPIFECFRISTSPSPTSTRQHTTHYSLTALLHLATPVVLALFQYSISGLAWETIFYKIATMGKHIKFQKAALTGEAEQTSEALLGLV